MHCVGYVELSDPGYMKFVYILEQSLRNLKTTMHQNVVPKIVHTQDICHHAWKTVRTTLQCIVVLKSRKKFIKSRKIMRQICPTVFLVF